MKKEDVFIESPYLEDTPVITGEDARRFMQRMRENRKESTERRKQRIENYEALIQIFEG
mgnify:FL=1